MNTENVFTNILNVLSYIPGVSSISEIERMRFGEIKLGTIKNDNHEMKEHYLNHCCRGFIELIPVLGNLVLIVADISYACFLNYNENNIKDPNVQNTENWYKLQG